MEQPIALKPPAPVATPKEKAQPLFMDRDDILIDDLLCEKAAWLKRDQIRDILRTTELSDDNIVVAIPPMLKHSRGHIIFGKRSDIANAQEEADKAYADVIKDPPEDLKRLIAATTDVQRVYAIYLYIFNRAAQAYCSMFEKPTSVHEELPYLYLPVMLMAWACKHRHVDMTHANLLLLAKDKRKKVIDAAWVVQLDHNKNIDAFLNNGAPKEESEEIL